jgi:hypothetical protein
VYVSVRRWFSANAGLLAGAILALTPVAVLMFRFNNPDALLILLLVAGAWAVTRAIDSERYAARWMMLAGALVGFGFLTKMLQAFLVLPAFGLAYLIAGKPQLGKRIVHSLLAFGAMIVGAGWWIAIVELIPASARPYIGGSQNNSILELTIGYNGLGRLNGNETGSVGGGTGNPGWGGATGLQRLFGGEFAGQIAWLLPAALLATIVLVVAAWRAPRTDKTRAFAILWGGWLVVTGLVFSYMQGIIHSYYMTALAPAVAALIGAAAIVLWRRRTEWLPRATLAGGTLLTAGWSFSLLQATPTWLPWLRWVVLVAGVLAAGLVMMLPELKGRRTAVRRAGLFAAALLAVTALAGPAAYSVETINTAHAGALPSAGPAGVGGGRMGGGPGGAGGRMGTPPGTGTNGGPGAGTNGTGTPGTGTPGTGGDGGQMAGGFLGGGGTSGVSSGTTADRVRGTGDGDRRLQRYRSGAIAGRVPGAGCSRQGPLLRRERWPRSDGWWEQYLERDQQLGTAELPGPDHRQHHRLRPDHRLNRPTGQHGIGVRRDEQQHDQQPGRPVGRGSSAVDRWQSIRGRTAGCSSGGDAGWRERSVEPGDCRGG